MSWARTACSMSVADGYLAVLLAASGRTVVGADPAGASLEVAKSKDAARRISWVHGDAGAVPPSGADLAVMTGTWRRSSSPMRTGRPALKQIDKIAKLYLQAMKLAARLERVPRSKKRPYLHARYAVSRTRVEMSNLVRDIDFHPFEKKRLIDKIHQTVERVHFLEREIAKLERRVDASKADVQAEARKDLRARRQELGEIEVASEVSPSELKRALQVILRGEQKRSKRRKS